MFESPGAMLVIYSLAALLAAFSGGSLPALLHLTHTRLQLAVSFVGGLMLGLALLGMLPHAVAQMHGIQQAAGWLVAGFLAMFLLQRFLPFHHHDVSEGSPVEPCGHTHPLAERSARSLSWMGVAIGLSVHSIFDGVAMAAAVAAGHESEHKALGLGAALAVILHKPFSALAITTLMASSGATRRSQMWMVAAFALVTPVGALLFYFGLGEMAHAYEGFLGAVLAFCAGTFLCIACSDLLPELQFHLHDRTKLSISLIAGIAVAVLIATFGHADHGHNGHDSHDAEPHDHTEEVHSH